MNTENRISTVCAGFLFTVFGAFIVLKSARDALFLSHYSPKLLPYLMAITTLTGTIIAAIYWRILKFVTLIKALRFSFIIFALGTAALWIAIVSGWFVATLLLYVWTGVFGTLATVQAWSLITERMLSRQARRSFQIIGSGSILGGLMGGLLARWTTHYISVAALLPLVAVLIVSAILLANTLAKVLPASTTIQQESNESGRVVPKQFLIILIGFVALTTIVSSFADFQIKVFAQNEIGTADGLAFFFGTFYAYSGAATVLFQLLCVGPLMRRLPLATTLAMTPGALFLGNGFLFLANSLTAAVVLKAGESTLDHSIDRASMELLYMAIPDSQKVRLKSLVDTIAVRSTELLAAGILILLISVFGFPISILAIIGMALTLAAILLSFGLGKEYTKLLQNSVHREEIRFSRVRSNVFTSEFYNLLPDVMNHANKNTVLDLLDILSTNKKLTPHLESMLKHLDSDVRLKALQILFTRKEDLSSHVVPMLSDPDRRIRLEAMHYLYSQNSSPAVSAISELRKDSDPGIQAALAAAPLNDEDERQHLIAFETLSRMLKELPPNGRAEIAGVLGYVQPSQTSEKLLRTVLSDASTEVQRAALKSIERVAPPGLAEDLIQALDVSPLTTEIRTSLVSYGESLIPELQKMLDDRQKSRDQKKLMIKIARTIGGVQAREMLLSMAKAPELSIRFTALKALNRLKKTSIDIPVKAAEELVAQEVGSLNVEMQREQFIGPQPGGLMERVLRQRQQWAQERIFRALGLLYDLAAIENAYIAWRSQDPKQADKAAEWLDSTLRPEHRNDVLRFVDPHRKIAAASTPKARKSILLGYIGGRDELPSSALIMELTADELQQWLGELQQVLKTFPGLTLVEETLNWKSGAMSDAKSSKYLTTIQKLETLSQADIFGGLGPQELLLLANQCTEVEFQADDMIVREGEDANEIFVIIRGELERVRFGRTLEPMMTNESFGVLAAITQTKHFFSVRAKSHSLCLRIQRNAFQEIMEDYPVIAYGIFRVVTEKMQLILDRVQELEQQNQKEP